jgi:hypothetical protein
MLGKLLAGAVRIVNIPARLAEAASDVVLDEPGATKDALGTSEPLERIAEILEESLDGEMRKKER